MELGSFHIGLKINTFKKSLIWCKLLHVWQHHVTRSCCDVNNHVLVCNYCWLDWVAIIMPYMAVAPCNYRCHFRCANKDKLIKLNKITFTFWIFWSQVQDILILLTKDKDHFFNYIYLFLTFHIFNLKPFKGWEKPNLVTEIYLIVRKTFNTSVLTKVLVKGKRKVKMKHARNVLMS